MIVLIILCLITSSHSANFTSIEDSLILSMVPRGRIMDKSGREIEVKTIAGTKIKIEFYRNGSFQEASGKDLNRGDVFEPGQGLITLSSAARSLPAILKTSTLNWTLEKDLSHGWIYEFFSVNEEGPELFSVNASNGKLFKN